MIWILVNSLVASYLALQLVLGIGASLSWLWECFWIDQNFFGKVCATLFYIPAYVIGLLKYAVVFVIFWALSIFGYYLNWFVETVMFWLYDKFEKFDL